MQIVQRKKIIAISRSSEVSPTKRCCCRSPAAPHSAAEVTAHITRLCCWSMPIAQTCLVSRACLQSAVIDCLLYRRHPCESAPAAVSSTRVHELTQFWQPHKTRYPAAGPCGGPTPTTNTDPGRGGCSISCPVLSAPSTSTSATVSFLGQTHSNKQNSQKHTNWFTSLPALSCQTCTKPPKVVECRAARITPSI